MGNACHISKGKVKGKEQHVRPRPRRDDNIKNGLKEKCVMYSADLG
jgi:hypothetical protein